MTRKHEEHPRSHHAKAEAAPPKTRKPRFAVGDKVKYLEQDGEIVEAQLHDADWFDAGLEQFYVVRLPAAPGQDHQFDTICCVPESEIDG